MTTQTTTPKDIVVKIEALPTDWKCVRCRQHLPECSPSANNYGLCYRCQNYMLHEMPNRCVSCGNDEADNNLCDECRASRIAAYDARLIESLKEEK